MKARLDWRATYRIVPSRFPAVGIFDSVADPRDLETVLLLEAATNPRVMEEAGELALVRPKDRISGPNSTPVMASFTHVTPSRFSDGSFGVYYAAHDERTAIAETAYHRARFLRDAGLPNERLDMRVYGASVRGNYDDLRRRPMSDPRYDPTSYARSQAYAAKLYAADKVDGIVFRAVRNPSGECVAAFRPRLVGNVRVLRHLEYRFEDYELRAVVVIDARGRIP